MMPGGLQDQLERFLEVAGPLGIIICTMGLLVLFLMAALGRRDLILAVFLLALPFSGSVIPWLNSGSTLFRWSVMIILALTAIARVQWPGVATLFMALAACIAIPMGLGDPRFGYTMQKGVLFIIMMAPMAAALAYQLRTREEVDRVMRYIIIAGALVCVLGLISLPQLRAGERFSGATTSAPLFVMTGGIFLAFTLWGAIQLTGPLRLLAIISLIGIALTNVISGQRAGTVAGFIACLPLLMRFGLKKLMIVGLALAVVFAGTWVFFTLVPEQAEFVQMRYFQEGSSGRVERWQYGISLCTENLLIGKGMGSAGFVRYTFHNGFLSVWHDSGILGLLLFIAAFAVTGIRCCQVALYQPTRDMGRLFVGIFLALGFMVLLEESVWSPSNVAGSFMMILMVLSSRMAAIIKQEQLDMLYADYADDSDGYYPEYEPDLQYQPST